METRIAEYRHAGYQRATSVLYADRIHVVSEDSDVTIPLDRLSGIVNRYRLRSQWFGGGIGLTFIGVVVACIDYIQSLPGIFPRPIYLSERLVYFVPFIGLILTIANVRKYETAVFVSYEGIQQYTVTRRGPDKKSYETFIAQISAAIAALSVSQQG
jgi:hypothetical protein